MWPVSHKSRCHYYNDLKLESRAIKTIILAHNFLIPLQKFNISDAVNGVTQNYGQAVMISVPVMEDLVH